ncbi:M23 family peptidase [Sphingorhabdus pulchriflava]|uniref:M23 family peptidase n=1 Tax=Sphingorhabdus pulchriflava TaxID=2292257 RepID=A0A371B6K1_9SPHN|nr:M23 family metallopeptidase [Sphingorhabdus pulchriflava]RDV03073.1 M23 family peptidase [Sphingorhabdus pulchriflava]
MLLFVAAVASCTAHPSAEPLPVAVSPPAKVEPTKFDAPVTPHSARDQFWLARPAVQGSVTIARAPSDAVKVTFNGAQVPLSADGFLLVGFDRDAENSASLVAHRADGTLIEQYIPVRPGNWAIQHVNANPLGAAKTSEEFQARRGPELARINAARAQIHDSGGWRQDFIWPLKGRISGRFGAQRVYNGTPGSYHSGLDIAMPTGTAFVAPADGIVTLTAKQPFTLEGHLLMIDHGMGLNSAFLHCSELLVEEGQVVKQGQVIGRVGATGRASGPHLHWGMKWRAARVDPLALLPAQ